MALLKKSLNKNQAISLKIPAEASFISLVRLVVAAHLRENSVFEEELEDLKLVLSEFLAKAIEAHLTEIFSLEISFEKDLATILIQNLEEFKPDALFNSRYLNFEAIISLIDDFDLILGEKQRIEVKITKRFNFQ